MSRSDSSKSGKPGSSESQTELRQDANELRDAVQSKKGLLAEVGMDAKSRRKPAPSLDGPRKTSETRLIRVPNGGGTETDAERLDNPPRRKKEHSRGGW